MKPEMKSEIVIKREIEGNFLIVHIASKEALNWIITEAPQFSIGDITSNVSVNNKLPVVLNISISECYDIDEVHQYLESYVNRFTSKVETNHFEELIELIQPLVSKHFSVFSKTVMYLYLTKFGNDEDLLHILIRYLVYKEKDASEDYFGPSNYVEGVSNEVFYYIKHRTWAGYQQAYEMNAAREFLTKYEDDLLSISDDVLSIQETRESERRVRVPDKVNIDIFYMIRAACTKHNLNVDDRQLENYLHTCSRSEDPIIAVLRFLVYLEIPVDNEYFEHKDIIETITDEVYSQLTHDKWKNLMSDSDMTTAFEIWVKFKYTLKNLKELYDEKKKSDALRR